MDPVALKPFIDYGLVGVLVGVVVLLHWHAIKVQIPALLSAFREELREERESCRAERLADRAEHLRAFEGVQFRLDRLADRIGPKIP